MRRTGETGRRAVHFAVGGLAFLLRDLTPLQAACAAGAAILSNVFVLPRVAPSLFRGEERQEPWRSGVVIYPVAVLLLVLLFHRHMEVAGAAWGIMAAGDSAAGLVGRRYGRRPIPWNRLKTVEGSLAFAMAATLFSWAILVWMGRGGAEAVLLAGSTSLFAAFIAGLVQIDADRLAAAAPGIGVALLIGLAVNAALAILFGATRTVDRSGMIAGFFVGVLTFAL